MKRSMIGNEFNEPLSLIKEYQDNNSSEPTNEKSTDESTSDKNESRSNNNSNNRSGKFGFGIIPKFDQIIGRPTTSSSIPVIRTNSTYKIINGIRPTIPSVDKVFTPFTKIPILGEILNIPNYFKVNNLKGAIDYMTKYGHLENTVSIFNQLIDLFKFIYITFYSD